MTSPDEYNPLDYQNLTRHCVDELMRRGPFELPLKQDFFGAGVYALFYTGNDPIYAKIRSPNADWPIYVGKAVPPGGRKGGGKPEMAMAGGNDPSKLGAALEGVKDWVASK